MHFYIDYPNYERELSIIEAKVPGIDKDLAQQIAAFVQKIRKEKLKKKPSIAETLDWAKVLTNMKVKDLEEEQVSATYNFLLKYEEDLALVSKL